MDPHHFHGLSVPSAPGTCYSLDLGYLPPASLPLLLLSCSAGLSLDATDFSSRRNGPGVATGLPGESGFFCLALYFLQLSLGYWWAGGRGQEAGGSILFFIVFLVLAQGLVHFLVNVPK